MLVALGNSNDPRHHEFATWLADVKPDGFDPAAFDRAAVNHIFADGLKGLREWFGEPDEDWDDDVWSADDDDIDDRKTIQFPTGKP